MTVDEALEETTCISAGSNISNTARAAVVLAAEVRRLRDVYERIAEIPAIGLSCGEPTIARQHVLRAISGEERLPWMEDYATVCKERDRLRAAVEAARALDPRHYSSAPLYRDDVLAALEVE